MKQRLLMGRSLLPSLVGLVLAFSLVPVRAGTPTPRNKPMGEVAQPVNGQTPQLVTTQRAITVVGQGQVTAPADRAQLEFNFGSQVEETTDSTESITDRQQRIEKMLQPIVDAVVDQEVPRRDIQLRISALESPRMLITLRGKPSREKVQELVVAVDRATKANRQFFLQSIGAAYSVSNCQPLEQVARRIAFQDAQNQARLMLGDLNLEVGDILFVTVYPLSGYPAAFSNCGARVSSPAIGLGIPTEDSLPPYNPSDAIEVQVRSQISITYGIQEAGKGEG